MPARRTPLAPSPGHQQTADIKDPNILQSASPSASSPVATTPGGAGAGAPLPTARAPQRTPLASTKPQPRATKAAPAPPLQQRQPQPIDKMAMASFVSPNPTPTPEPPRMSMTSKEWVIPPRPKPGRKPATDTPPTKRKAQNRAAQRAFRERRAARVGELEEQLDHQRSSYEKDEAGLKDKIHELELDLQSFRSRCLLLENMLERERQERIRAETEAETLKRRMEDDNARRASMSRSRQHSYDRLHSPVHPPPHRGSTSSTQHSSLPSTTNIPISQIISPPDTLDDSSETPLTCGNCSPNGPCACAEEVLASVTADCSKCNLGSSCRCLNDVSRALNQSCSTLKRPVSSYAESSSEKRQRSTAASPLGFETDMTTASSVPVQTQYEPPMVHAPSVETIPMKDSCGFCKEGTYCMCAEAAMATPAMTPTDTLPPITRQIHTPPPSETDVVSAAPIPMEFTAEGAVKLPPRRPRPQAAPAASRGCGPNGPGSCATCQADPKAGLFCRLMAASFDREPGGAGGGCCGGKGRAGGCCKSAPKEKITLPSLPSLGLSCAEAYQTLSSHRNFEQAADDIGSWLPKLKATPRPSVGARAPAPGRMQIEVEAASIMSVLKDFDVRFGREC